MFNPILLKLNPLAWQAAHEHCRLWWYVRLANVMRLARQAQANPKVHAAALGAAWLGGLLGGQLYWWMRG